MTQFDILSPEKANVALQNKHNAVVKEAVDDINKRLKDGIIGGTIFTSYDKYKFTSEVCKTIKSLLKNAGYKKVNVYTYNKNLCWSVKLT